MPDATAPTLANVTKRYGDTVALDRVDLSLQPGKFHGLVGPNGSGKTTFFYLLAGLGRPAGGRIARGELPVGVGFQEPRFFPELTPRENLSVFRGFAADPPPADWTDRLVEALRLEPVVHRRASELSGGFRKKLDLAIAFVKRPRLVLLDEPYADVDDYSQRLIGDFLEEYQSAEPDRTVVVSTHDVAAFQDLFDRLTVLVDGTVRFDGEPGDDVLAQYRSLLEA